MAQDRAVRDAVRADAVAVGHEQETPIVELALARQQARSAGHGTPGLASVVRTPEPGRARVHDARDQGARAFSRPAAAAVEDDEAHPAVGRRSWRWSAEAGVGEARDLVPGS